MSITIKESLPNGAFVEITADSIEEVEELIRQWREQQEVDNDPTDVPTVPLLPPYVPPYIQPTWPPYGTGDAPYWYRDNTWSTSDALTFSDTPEDGATSSRAEISETDEVTYTAHANVGCPCGNHA